MLDEPIPHRHSTLSGKILVCSLAANAIRVSLYAHFPGWIVVQLPGHLGQNRLSFGWYR